LIRPPDSPGTDQATTGAATAADREDLLRRIARLEQRHLRATGPPARRSPEATVSSEASETSSADG